MFISPISGNDHIHELTKQRPSELYFKFKYSLEMRWGKYKNLTVQSEEYKYRLSFDEDSYEGTPNCKPLSSSSMS